MIIGFATSQAVILTRLKDAAFLKIWLIRCVLVKRLANVMLNPTARSQGKLIHAASHPCSLAMPLSTTRGIIELPIMSVPLWKEEDNATNKQCKMKIK